MKNKSAAAPEIAAKLKERETLNKALMRTMEDPEYRLRLKKEPIAVLQEAGIEVPKGVEVRVLEFDPNIRYLILPPVRSASKKGQ